MRLITCLLLLPLVVGCVPEGPTRLATGTGSPSAVPSATPTTAPSDDPNCDFRDGVCPPQGVDLTVHVEVVALTKRVRAGGVVRVQLDSECPDATFLFFEYLPVGSPYPKSVPLILDAHTGAERDIIARAVVPRDVPPQVAQVIASTNCSHASDAGNDFADVEVLASQAALPRTG